jgi:hypothetical protein
VQTSIAEEIWKIAKVCKNGGNLTSLARYLGEATAEDFRFERIDMVDSTYMWYTHLPTKPGFTILPSCFCLEKVVFHCTRNGGVQGSH